MRISGVTVLIAGWVSTSAAQTTRQPDWRQVQDETIQHFQAILRFNTADPPGNEQPEAEYLKGVLERAGIPVQLFTLEPNRTNLVARIKGSGKKRPLLLMGHLDVVPVDPAKWTFPPFSGTRDGGYVYSRGAIDDKSHVASFLMTMLTLKRLEVPLDRDVIFLAEAGEENNTRVGMQFMVEQHFPEIEAEYCFAEGGYVRRVGGQDRFAAVETLEKIQRTVELTARGAAGHGSIPLTSNAVVHLSRAIAALGGWQPAIRLNPTTTEYFKRLAGISPPEDAARYRALVGTDSAAAARAAAHLVSHEPIHASMLWPSVSPTMVNAGYRVNVIPSEAKATLDVRLLPDDNPAEVLELLRKVVNDPAVEVKYGQRDSVPPATADLTSEAFKVIEAAVTKHYQTVTLPTMATATTDMPYLRSRGVQCYGIGAALDLEDAAKGFGPHSDQERILESELHRFIRFAWDVVVQLAGAK